MKILRIMMACTVLLLTACGGGDGGSTTDNGGGTPPPKPEVKSTTVMAMDFKKTVPVNPKIKRINLNLSIYVASKEKKPLALEAVTPISRNAQCKVLDINPDMLQFTVSPERAGACDYRYTVTDGKESASGIANIVVTAKAPETVTSRLALLPADSQLPTITKALSLGDTLSLDLSTAPELSAGLSAMTNPLFSEATITYGDGTPSLTESGMLTYEAIAVSSTVVNYYVLDNNSTEDDRSDDVVYSGQVIIDVSGDANTAPTARDVTARDIPSGNEIEIDILDFQGTGSLVDDAEGDDIQLIAVITSNAAVNLSAPNDVTNTKFKFKAFTHGSRTITYVVYDHNTDGIATGTIKVQIGYSAAGDIVFNVAGYLKLFENGLIGGVSQSSRLASKIEKVNTYLKDNDKTVLSITNIGMHNFALKISDESYIFLGDDVNDNIKLSNVKSIFFKDYLTSRKTVSDIFYVLFNDGHVKAYSQPAYGNHAYGIAEVKAFNKINFADVKNAKMLDTSTLYLEYTAASGKENKIVTMHWNGKIIDKVIILNEKTLPCMPKSVNDIFYVDTIRYGLEFMVSDSANKKVCIYDPESKYDFAKTFKTIFESKGIIKQESARSIKTFLSSDGTLYAINSILSTPKVISENVLDYKVGSLFVAYTKFDGSFDGFSFKHLVYGAKDHPGGLDISPNFTMMTTSQKNNIKFFIVGSDSVGFITKDNKVAFLTQKGYQEPNKEEYLWLKGDRNVGWGNQFHKPTYYQGGNTFIALNKNKHKWEFFSPLEGWNGEFTCKFNFSDFNQDKLIEPEILTRCNVALFLNNGMQGNTKLSAIPIESFQDNEFLFELTDIDNDGMSNSLEKDSCLKVSHIRKNQHFWCTYPSQSDTDWDQVRDSFELSHDSLSDTQTSNIKEKLSDSWTDIIDTYKDINLDSIPDYLN
ncbi:hypothetical protein [Photobacterium indicum]|uniref:hypothetical protein n=1 Tax=Photobacterium indicum TaxID=81447 RepID=UPI003D0A1142